jgi:hypothetical protein
LDAQVDQSVFSRKFRNVSQNGPYGLQAFLYFEGRGCRDSLVGHHTVTEGITAAS